MHSNMVDLGEILTTPMPSRVTADLLVLDASLGGRLKRWAEDVLSVNPAAPVEVIERVRETITTLDGQFADPDRLELDRPKPRSIAFGYGAHFCVGAALGRAEAQMALEALLALPGHFEEPPGQNDWTMSITNRGLRSYQVRLAV